VLIYRLLPIIIIGGGFLICKAIFNAYPLDFQQFKEKENKSTVISMWFFAFLIICGQLIYIWSILNTFLKISDSVKYPLLLIPLFIIFIYGYILYKNR
jgi:membrane-anchored protein YejM (alkaline phosphatase superfamily)